MFYLLLFLFPCNGHLPYGSIPHPQMGEKSRQRVVKHVLRLSLIHI